MEILRTINTIDAATGKPLHAEVVTDGRRVYLQRRGDPELVLLEKDLVLYRALSSRQVKRPAVVTHLVIEPTYRCNMDCPLCFTHRHGRDASLEEIRAEMEHHRGRVISISGGEPTVRDDLPEIIRIIARHNIPLLATNGLRLADHGYLRELIRAGLRHVTFSFNGFSAQSNRATNGRNTVETKLAALQNLVAADLRFLLSMVLLRGSNEGEVGPVLELARGHGRQIKEVRLRSAMPLGKHPELEPFFASEILDLVCHQAHLKRQAILATLRLYGRLPGWLPRVQVVQKSCSLSFFLRRGPSGLAPLRLRWGTHTLWDLVKICTPRSAARDLLQRRGIWQHDESLLKVSIRVWPTIRTMDLQDHFSHCNSRYIIGDKKGQPVCYANIMHDLRQRVRERLPSSSAGSAGATVVSV